MTSAPAWKTFLKKSLQENIEKIGLSATYASIATVKPDNTPAVRTVVMRGFAGEHHSQDIGWQSDLLVVITDKRSDKIKEIQYNPSTEINWYMDGTKEQFRIQGSIDIIDSANYNSPNLKGLSSHFTKSNSASIDQENLAIQMFLRQQQQTDQFSWPAERLRHFHQFGAKMRKDLTVSGKEEEMEINDIDQETGWFKSYQHQDLLQEAFDNFVLLVIKVTSVRHWSPTTGTKSML